MRKILKGQRKAKPLGGTYALILFLAKATTIRVGALGRFRFPRGYYIYIGSALNGLDARLRRHLARKKQMFWHIDYILKHARVVEIWMHRSTRRLECAWATRALALRNAEVIAERFGSSDCHCRTHLVYLNRHFRPERAQSTAHNGRCVTNYGGGPEVFHHTIQC